MRFPNRTEYENLIYQTHVKKGNRCQSSLNYIGNQIIGQVVRKWMSKIIQYMCDLPFANVFLYSHIGTGSIEKQNLSLTEHIHYNRITLKHTEGLLNGTLFRYSKA